MQTVTIGGKTYPILFDANVLAKIQERYGSVDGMGENLPKIQETIWILTQIINEGRRYREIVEGQPQEGDPMTEERLGMLLTGEDLFANSRMAQAIINAFNEGMGGRKNPGAGQGKKKRPNGKRKKKASSTLPGSSTSP